MDPTFLFDANLPALDLVNTVQAHDGRRVDLLDDDEAAAAWLRAWEASGRATEGSPDARAGSAPAEGDGGGWPAACPAPAGLRSRLVALREATRGLADALIDRGAPDPDAVAALNRVLGDLPAVARLVADGHPGDPGDPGDPGASGNPGDPGGYRLERGALGGAYEALLLPVAESAARLVTELDPGRVGRCASDACVLYFYDTSRNRSRRWCSMERCGNRAKVAAHYRRERDG